MKFKPTVKFNDTTWRKITAGLRVMDKLDLKVGILANRAGLAHHADNPKGPTVLEVGALQQLGTTTIPARPWVGLVFEEKPDELKMMQLAAVKSIIEKGTAPKVALSVVGEWASSQMRERITSGEYIGPPLAESTIRRKGHDRPLVDTGQMSDAIDFSVTQKGGK